VRARISRQPAALINPYGTDLVRQGFLYLLYTQNGTQIEADNSFNSSVQVVRQPYGCNKFWARISKCIVQHLRKRQSVQYGCVCTNFEVAVGVFLPVNSSTEFEEEISKLLVLILLICNFQN
jgi:hypothetical protein